MPTLLIVIGSTRPGRNGRAVADWFIADARAHGRFEVTVADLAEVGLPLLDEPNHPRLGQYTQEHTRRWSAMVAAADAVVLVTPEYNHSVPPALKNAIDYLHNEWTQKPVGVVSYGGISGGIRAVQALQPIFGALLMRPVRNLVHLPFFNQSLSDGVFHADEGMRAAATAMLDELAELTRLLAP